MGDDRLERWLGNEYASIEGLERRHWFRLTCEWPVELVVSPAIKGSVSDVSPRGLQVQLTQQVSFKPGQQLKARSLRPVHPSLQPEVDCQVRWVQREGKHFWVGLSFVNNKSLEQSWVQSLLTKVFYRGSEQKRTNLRICCHIPATLRVEVGSLPVTILDLSLGGALLEAGETYQAGSRIHLQLGPWAPLPELNIEGVVQRTAKRGELFHFGVKFGRRQHREIVLQYLRQAYQVARLEKS